MSNPRIGFIGVGLMGHGMAKNLLLKGFAVSILGHRNRAPVEDLVSRGAREARDVTDVVQSSDIVFLCVTGTPEVEDLMHRPGGVLASARAGQIVVDTSTSQPASTLRLAEQARAKGVRFVDAPLARTPVEAEEGRLNSFVGADAQTFAELRPALAAYSENIFHMGEVGTGHKIKLLNNAMGIGIAALTSEMLAACAKLGVDWTKFFEVVSGGPLNNVMFQRIAGGAAEGDLDRMKFTVRNAAKDLRYYAQMAAEAGVAGALAPAVLQTLLQTMGRGYGDQFLAHMVKGLLEVNGVAMPVTEQPR
jgi:3-hydroxyisobutyrate dehydrogenase-like beta-hydroxyacid dehydrogenase